MFKILMVMYEVYLSRSQHDVIVVTEFGSVSVHSEIICFQKIDMAISEKDSVL